MRKIIKNKYFSWIVVTFFVLSSPFVFDLAFSKDIDSYNRNKELYANLISSVKDFKNKHYPDKIDKKELVDLTEKFINGLDSGISSKDMKIISAKINNGSFKVVVELRPSVTSCVFKNEIQASTTFVNTLTPFRKCREEYTQYQFVAV